MIDELSQRARAAVRDRRAWALEAEIDTLKGKLAEALAQRINGLQQRVSQARERLEELDDMRQALDAQDDDDVIEGTSREVGPHWTENFSDRETFKAKMAELTLTGADVFTALSNASGQRVERVSDYPGTLVEALEALNAYVDGKSSGKTQEGLF